MRVPWDNQWGTSTESGNWTGIVGTLQHHKADFSMMLSWMETRLPVVDYSRIYASEPLVMITSKPLPLSQSFALVRPFSANLWVAMVVSTVVAGVVLWGLQGAWAWVSGGRALGLGRSLMLTLAILMEDPPSRLPKNITAQMLLGWWWVYCMLLTITYRSSLIAHLTVPGKSATLESLEDLLEVHRKDHWTWGYEPTYGSGWEFLKMNENPTVRKVFSELMLVDLQEQMDRVLAGRHAFITWKYYIRSIIASRYTNARSYTPIHTAKEELFNYGGYGWGFRGNESTVCFPSPNRKGAPFRPRIDELKQRLLEAGLINFWMDELIEASGRKTRTKRNKKEGGGKKEEEVDSSNEGTFYLLAMGYGIALMAFLFELLFHRCRSPAPAHQHLSSAHPHPSSAHNSRSPPTQY
ncbi:Glutamate receptor 2-like 15, partial [Homarus americanus]